MAHSINRLCLSEKKILEMNKELNRFFENGNGRNNKKEAKYFRQMQIILISHIYATNEIIVSTGRKRNVTAFDIKFALI